MNGAENFNNHQAIALRPREMPVITAEFEDLPFEPWAWEQDFNPPLDSEFVDEKGVGRDFIPAPQLEQIAVSLFDKYQSDFPFFSRFKIAYLWKRKGGASGGRVTLGKCVKLSGLARYFSDKPEIVEDEDYSEFANYDFVIWAAADHCRLWLPKWQQITALVFHELLHIDAEQTKPKVRGHDFEGFAREIEEFGLWKRDINRIYSAFKTVEKQQGDLF
ncbi:MAG TPA: putative metallopeptidase [Pyrinomonadaceae bacterium]|jgi:hypothetical protein